MIWVLLTVVAVLLVGVFAALVAGRIRYDPLAEPVRSQPEVGLSDGFTARNIADVHFDTALRGYRMDQVDRVLDTLQDRIAEQERELASLRPAATAPRDPEPDTSPQPEAGAPEPEGTRERPEAGERQEWQEPTPGRDAAR